MPNIVCKDYAVIHNVDKRGDERIFPQLIGYPQSPEVQVQ